MGLRRLTEPTDASGVEWWWNCQDGWIMGKTIKESVQVGPGRQTKSVT